MPRVVLVAYAYEPNRGSEPGVGWNWAHGLSTLGYDVTVYAHASQKSSVESATREEHKVEVIFVGSEHRQREQGNRIFLQLYYLYWQILTALKIRKSSLSGADTVHFLTYGGIRMPTFGWLTGNRYIIGPLGGGEEPPLSFILQLPKGMAAKEVFRIFLNRLCLLDPTLWLSYIFARSILVKTTDSARAIPRIFRKKVRVQLEIGTQNGGNPPIDLKPPVPTGRLRILFVARFVYWKGLSLAVDAADAFTREFKSSLDFVVIGDGADRNQLQKISKNSNINLTHISWLSQNELWDHYKNSDILLFPSLHDSSGNVVLEALSHGLPVLALNIGGPATILAGTDMLVDVASRSYQDVVNDIAERLYAISMDASGLQSLRQQATRIASSFDFMQSLKAHSEIEYERNFK